MVTRNLRSSVLFFAAGKKKGRPADRRLRITGDFLGVKLLTPVCNLLLPIQTVLIFHSSVHLCGAWVHTFIFGYPGLFSHKNCGLECLRAKII